MDGAIILAFLGENVCIFNTQCTSTTSHQGSAILSAVKFFKTTEQQTLCYQLGVTNLVYQMLQKWSNVA